MTRRGAYWIKENNFKINFFTNDEGALYYMTDSEIMLVQQDYKIDGLYPGMDIGFADGIYPLCPGMMYPGQTPENIYENDLMYMAETGDIGMDYPDYKYVSKIILRLQIERGSYLRMEIMYDSDGIWERILDINGTGEAFRKHSGKCKKMQTMHVLGYQAWEYADIIQSLKII